MGALFSSQQDDENEGPIDYGMTDIQYQELQ